jgi:rare lipoprotein A
MHFGQSRKQLPYKPPARVPKLLLVGTLATVLTLVATCFAGSARDGSARIAIPGKTISGKATYYPDRLNGHKTASGEAFNQSDHTAASNKLPLGTTAKVINLKTGKSTDVTVTDRGPALGNRKIDLSKKAAKDIGLTQREGTTPVKIKVTASPPGVQPTPAR